MTTNLFPFLLSDLEGWVITYKNGNVTNFILDREAVNIPTTASKGVVVSGQAYHGTSGSAGYTSLSAYCKHDPAKEPVFSHPVKGGGQVDLYIADSAGARAHYKEFDIVIDGGNVIHPFEPSQLQVLKGDPILVKEFKKYEMVNVLIPRILHIEWVDRAEPDLSVEFWPALAQHLEVIAGDDKEKPLKVLTVCQGGHGRSGSALTALMMVWTDYSALDAITHLRAVHCARAIESKVQHAYLDELSKHLGRAEDADKAHDVKDFRARFFTLKSKFSKPYQSRLQSKEEGNVASHVSGR